MSCTVVWRHLFKTSVTLFQILNAFWMEFFRPISLGKAFGFPKKDSLKNVEWCIARKWTPDIGLCEYYLNRHVTVSRQGSIFNDHEWMNELSLIKPHPTYTKKSYGSVLAISHVTAKLIVNSWVHWIYETSSAGSTLSILQLETV